MLIDASFLYALNDVGDGNHAVAYQFLQMNADDMLVPNIVLAEAGYLIRRRIGQRALADFLLFFDNASIVQLVAVDVHDLSRARQIMIQYADNDFDLADCCIMALSERLNIRQVCTFDRRDFSVFRPRHCDYLDLLP